MSNILIIIFFNICLTAYSFGANDEQAFISADFIEYNEEEDFIYAKGNIQITLGKYILNANSLLYDIENDMVWAEGDVKVKDDKDRIIFGQTIFFKDKLKEGIISDFIMKLQDNSILASRLAKRLNSDHFTLYRSSFTPCSIQSDCKPIWQISAQKAEVDFKEENMSYKNLFFEIYGVPIFYTPYFSHPTPSAKAKSGILVPSIKKNYLTIPIYFRAKPNMDLTLSPRIFTKYTLMDLEFRHKLDKGDYVIEASVGKVPYKIKNMNGSVIKDANVRSYHIFTHGNFVDSYYKYGFNLKRTSDKAYLKNYHGLNNSFLDSKIYLQKIDYTDYLSVSALHFQGLRTNDTEGLDPLILPQIRTKNVFGLNDDESIFFTIQNNSLIYMEETGRKLGRAAFQLSITNDFITKNGHLLNISLNNRTDIYSINQMLNSNANAISSNQNDLLIRDIPELQTTWRYPLVKPIGPASSFIIEPVVSSIVGKKFKPSYNKFNYIDSNKYELSDDNLFNLDKYSGIDYHEFGNRLSYGVNSALLSNDNYFSLFLGQRLHKYNNSIINDNAENVGKTSLNLSGSFEILYRFRKSKDFSPIRDEFGVNFQNEKIQFTTAFVKLENLKKYYPYENRILSKNRAKQIYYDIDYHLTENWLIGNDMRVNLSDRKARILNKSIKVTYLKDCVRITGKISDDYTSDNTRGIRKTPSSIGISIGLKVLNM